MNRFCVFWFQVGTVLPAGGGATQARMAALAAGLPVSSGKLVVWFFSILISALSTTNRQCSSGLQAFVNIAGAIKTGTIKVFAFFPSKPTSWRNRLVLLPVLKAWAALEWWTELENLTPLYNFLLDHRYDRFNMWKESRLTAQLTKDANAKDCLTPMGITSENVAAKYNISREKQG